ncbi:unnamed protein product [Discosporangium mesarthrocarpum]
MRCLRGYGSLQCFLGMIAVMGIINEVDSSIPPPFQSRRGADKHLLQMRDGGHPIIHRSDQSLSLSTWRQYRGGGGLFRRRPRNHELSGIGEIDRPVCNVSASPWSRLSRKGVGTFKILCRRIRGLVGWVLDFITLKRVRQFKESSQGVWRHTGPIPARYRSMLQELRVQCAAMPGLESRSRKVRHDLNPITLCRFLEAAYWNLDVDGRNVSQRIADTVEWRESVGAHELKGGELIKDGSQGSLFVKGHDLERRPVVYLRPALGAPSNIKVTVFTLERAIRRMPRGSWQYTIVVDCQGMGLHNLPPLSYIKCMFSLLMNHYPMRIGVVLFANTGHSVMLCWRLLSPLIHARTKKKMRFIPHSKMARMTDYIHPSQLLSFVGGQSQWSFNPTEYFTNEESSV